MDFHSAFYEIDADHSGEITREELEDYMRKKNYKETFVKKWLSIFDVDDSGTITYEEYCTTLGLEPKEPEPQAAGASSSTAKAKTEEPMEVSEAPVAKKASAQVRSQPKAAEKAKPAEKTKPAEKAKSATTKARTDGKGSCRSGESRNSLLSSRCGVLMRFSGARVIQKKALYRIKPATVRGSGSGKKTAAKEKAQSTVTKEVNGENNGQTRVVPVNRSPKSYPSQESSRPESAKRRKPKDDKPNKKVAKLRKSIQPGTVLILLTGRHRGKRVVFLKQMLSSGMLLVTGPFKLNGCPLRRVHQTHVIATSTRVDLNSVTLPERLTDAYFQRAHRDFKKGTGADGDIFRKDTTRYELSQERKEDQKTVDNAVSDAIKAHKDAGMLRSYLRQMFALNKGQMPHKMVF